MLLLSGYILAHIHILAYIYIEREREKERNYTHIIYIDTHDYMVPPHPKTYAD